MSDIVNLGPVTVDQLGGYVSELHANGNTKFKENYKVDFKAYNMYTITIDRCALHYNTVDRSIVNELL